MWGQSTQFHLGKTSEWALEYDAKSGALGSPMSAQTWLKALPHFLINKKSLAKLVLWQSNVSFLDLIQLVTRIVRQAGPSGSFQVSIYFMGKNQDSTTFSFWNLEANSNFWESKILCQWGKKNFTVPVKYTLVHYNGLQCLHDLIYWIKQAYVRYKGLDFTFKRTGKVDEIMAKLYNMHGFLFIFWISLESTRFMRVIHQVLGTMCATKSTKIYPLVYV